jgi:GNAT superfamily N-acetyltransferase
MRALYEKIVLAFHLIRDAIRNKELLELWREQVFLDKVVIPVYVDLTALPDQKPPFQNSDYELVELNLTDLQSRRLIFLTPSRYYRALNRIKRGLRGFALLRGDTVVGDIWCSVPQTPRATFRNREFERLGIPFNNDDAIAADMYIDPAYRGKKLAVPLHLSLELILKKEGWQRLFSFYFEDNLLAKPMHWILKVKELPRFQESRFFRIKTYKSIPTDPSTKSTC